MCKEYIDLENRAKEEYTNIWWSMSEKDRISVVLDVISSHIRNPNGPKPNLTTREWSLVHDLLSLRLAEI
jgi:hypothetical protein